MTRERRPFLPDRAKSLYKREQIANHYIFNPQEEKEGNKLWTAAVLSAGNHFCSVKNRGKPPLQAA
uniref:Uncharacterized protein n=1 Tax=Setaria italica TaxID=4555 RepID=K3YBH5_SETIT